jgi:hypothetical protein
MPRPDRSSVDTGYRLRWPADARWGMARTNHAGSINRSAARRGWTDDRTCIRFQDRWPTRCRGGKRRGGSQTRRLAVAPLRVFVRSDRHTDRVTRDSSGRIGCGQAVRREVAASRGPGFGFQLLGIVSPDGRPVRLNSDARIDPIRVLVFRTRLSGATRGVLAGRRSRAAMLRGCLRPRAVMRSRPRLLGKTGARGEHIEQNDCQQTKTDARTIGSRHRSLSLPLAMRRARLRAAAARRAPGTGSAAPGRL